MMPFGGAIVDTPGIRGFGVIDLEKGETYHFFPEIFKKSSECRFHNCLHINEPGCAVIKALGEGTISWSRYKSYISIMEDDESKYR
jgi:ribosome biogenesis GTPase / thiamine phosphate phosphatase